MARSHYLSSELLGRRLEPLRRLPMPDRVQLRANVRQVADAGEYAAKVIALPVGRSRR